LAPQIKANRSATQAQLRNCTLRNTVSLRKSYNLVPILPLAAHTLRDETIISKQNPRTPKFRAPTRSDPAMWGWREGTK
jgi:hypothetical protein